MISLSLEPSRSRRSISAAASFASDDRTTDGACKKSRQFTRHKIQIIQPVIPAHFRYVSALYLACSVHVRRAHNIIIDRPIPGPKCLLSVPNKSEGVALV